MQILEKDNKVQVILGDNVGFRIYDFQTQVIDIIETSEQENLGLGVDSVPLVNSMALCYKSIHY